MSPKDLEPYVSLLTVGLAIATVLAEAVSDSENARTTLMFLSVGVASLWVWSVERRLAAGTSSVPQVGNAVTFPLPTTGGTNVVWLYDSDGRSMIDDIQSANGEDCKALKPPAERPIGEGRALAGGGVEIHRKREDGRFNLHFFHYLGPYALNYSSRNFRIPMGASQGRVAGRFQACVTGKKYEILARLRHKPVGKNYGLFVDVAGKRLERQVFVRQKGVETFEFEFDNVPVDTDLYFSLDIHGGVLGPENSVRITRVCLWAF